QNDLAAGLSINSITSAGTGYTLSGNSITLAGSITDSTVGGSNTISLPIIVNALNTPIAVTDAGETLTIGGTVSSQGVISGTGGITKTGAGTLVLSALNTISAGGNGLNNGVTISADTLKANSVSSFGSQTSNVALNGGTLETTATFSLSRYLTL